MTPAFLEQLLVGICIAVAASVLTLLGNWLIQGAQSRAVVRAELREFVRSMHLDTVATVADLDLLMRDLRVSVITGNQTVPTRGVTASEHVEAVWEGGLLRRLRLLKFGHPDPDVRAAAEQMEDAMWPYVSTATTERQKAEPDERTRAMQYADAAMRTLRAAVWTAPRRNIPRRRNMRASIVRATWRAPWLG